MDIGIDHVQLAFPLDLEAEGIHVVQPNDSTQATDTIAYIHRAVVDVQFWPLLTGVVNVDELALEKMLLNTGTLIHEARVSGRIDALTLASHGVDLCRSNMRIDRALLDGALLDIELSDTVPPDTTPSANVWKIAVEKLDINRSALTLHMPGDTLRIGAQITALKARQGYLDLDKGLYRVGSLSLDDSGVSYDSTYATTSPAAGAASAAAGGEAGQAITLNKAPLYVSSTAKNKAGTKTGTYWLYDGILINGRYRVTNSAARCGKLPVGQNVTGWVPASYCIASEEAKK